LVLIELAISDFWFNFHCCNQKTDWFYSSIGRHQICYSYSKHYLGFCEKFWQGDSSHRFCHWFSINVTGSAKTSLITHDRKFDFITQTQSLMNELYQISLPQTTRVKRSAFSSCFFQALWRAIRAVCGLDRALANQEMVECGCTAPWCWIMTLCFKIPFILVSFEPWMACNWA